MMLCAILLVAVMVAALEDSIFLPSFNPMLPMYAAAPPNVTRPFEVLYTTTTTKPMQIRMVHEESMPESRYLSCAFSDGKRLLILGGFDQSLLDPVESYLQRRIQDGWTVRAAPPWMRVGASACLRIDPTFYLMVGGLYTLQESGDLPELRNDARMSAGSRAISVTGALERAPWQSGQFPVATVGGSLCYDAVARVVTHSGGRTAHGISDAIYRWRPFQDDGSGWQLDELDRLPEPMMWHHSTIDKKQAMLVFGGKLFLRNVGGIWMQMPSVSGRCRPLSGSGIWDGRVPTNYYSGVSDAAASCSVGVEDVDGHLPYAGAAADRHDDGRRWTLSGGWSEFGDGKRHLEIVVVVVAKAKNKVQDRRTLMKTLQVTAAVEVPPMYRPAAGGMTVLLPGGELMVSGGYSNSFGAYLESSSAKVWRAGAWVTLASTPNSHAFSAATVAVDSKALLLVLTDSWNPDAAGRVLLYDIERDRWLAQNTSADSVPGPVRAYAGCALSAALQTTTTGERSELFVAGGLVFDRELALSERRLHQRGQTSARAATYLLEEGRWISHAPMPREVWRAQAVRFHDQIHVVGGYTAGGDVERAAMHLTQRFDRRLNRWTLLYATASFRQVSPLVPLLFEERLYAVQPFSGRVCAIAEVEQRPMLLAEGVSGFEQAEFLEGNAVLTNNSVFWLANYTERRTLVTVVSQPEVFWEEALSAESVDSISFVTIGSRKIAQTRFAIWLSFVSGVFICSFLLGIILVTASVQKSRSALPKRKRRRRGP